MKYLIVRPTIAPLCVSIFFPNILRFAPQTPQYDGSRTPNYASGNMTPLHEPGSQTPGRQSAWDPTITNTPARSSEFDEYSYDEASPSPAYNPGSGGGNTPGYQSDHGGQGGPYTPATPGGTGYGSEYSPYQQHDPSPQSYQPGASPSAYAGTPSPAGTGGYQATPSPGGSNYASPSPLAYSPMTPGGAASPFTSGSNMDSFSMSDWQTLDIEVRIRDTHDDSGLTGQRGIIRSTTGGNCAVFLPEEERVVNINGEHLEPIIPSPGDKVKVLLSYAAYTFAYS